MTTRSPAVDAFHAALAPPERKALDAIRRAVHAAAPGAEEYFHYGMPAVRFEGRPLVAWRAAAKHCAFHPLSGRTVAACAERLAAYDTSPGTIRFPPARVPSPALVRHIVGLRIAENRAIGAAERVKKATAKRSTPSAARGAAKRSAGGRAEGKRAVTRRSAAAGKRRAT